VNGISDCYNILVVNGFTFPSNPKFINEENSYANITIQSPENRSYNQNEIPLNFTIETDVPYVQDFNSTVFGVYFRLGCFLDSNSSKLTLNENDWGLLSTDNDVKIVLDNSENGYIGNARLENLSEGFHNITVLIEAEEYWISHYIPKWSVSSIISFKVDTTPPDIQVSSPEPKIYINSEVVLMFTINENVTKTSYILDGNEIQITDKQIEISNLANGNHTITVYSVDEAGNIGASKTIDFRVIGLTELDFLIVFLSVIGTVGIIVTCVYFGRKRKNKVRES
jgi:hypothetical protein